MLTPVLPVPILAVSIQYGVYDYRIILHFIASENDWKCERIFEDADDGLINFSYEFLTQAELPLVVPLSRFRHIRLCRQADSQAVTHSVIHR